MGPILTSLAVGGAVFGARAATTALRKRIARRRYFDARATNPTDEQLSVLRNTLRENDIVIFGDSGHDIPAIKTFVLHPAVQRVMTEESVKQMCLEIRTESDALIRDFEDGKLRAYEFHNAAKDFLVGGHIRCATSRAWLATRFAGFLERTREKGGPRLRCVDTRGRSDSAFQRYLNMHPISVTAAHIYGCAYKMLFDPHATLMNVSIEALARFRPRMAAGLLQTVLDDKATSDYIGELHHGLRVSSMSPVKSAVIFGQGHFNGAAGIWNMPDMAEHLRAQGYKVAVIPIYENGKQAQNSMNKVASLTTTVKIPRDIFLLAPKIGERSVQQGSDIKIKRPKPGRTLAERARRNGELVFATSS